MHLSAVALNKVVIIMAMKLAITAVTVYIPFQKSNPGAPSPKVNEPPSAYSYVYTSHMLH